MLRFLSTTGKFKRTRYRGVDIKRSDYKIAYVTLVSASRQLE